MSAMSSQRRKIARKHKDRVEIIRAAHKPDEYLKHRPHVKRLLAALNQERAQRERERELAASLS